MANLYFITTNQKYWSLAKKWCFKTYKYRKRKALCRKRNKPKQKCVYIEQLKVAEFAETEINSTWSRYYCYFHDLVPNELKASVYFSFLDLRVRGISLFTEHDISPRAFIVNLIFKVVSLQY
jgi:hypothetical protein